MTWEDRGIITLLHLFKAARPMNRGSCIAIPLTSHGLERGFPWFNKGAVVMLEAAVFRDPVRIRGLAQLRAITC